VSLPPSLSLSLSLSLSPFARFSLNNHTPYSGARGNGLAMVRVVALAFSLTSAETALVAIVSKISKD